jgi:solute carrier family 25 (mitochondrial oxoglutarate transporter), member 11
MSFLDDKHTISPLDERRNFILYSITMGGDMIMQFGMSGVAGCGATCFVHPLDVLKVNLQVDTTGRGPLNVAKTIFQQSGIRGLYAGLSAGIFRQITYGMPRMALYPIVVEKVNVFTGSKGGDMPLYQKFFCGATAGAIASLCGVPSEVTMVRMTADQKYPIGDPQRRNYTGVGNALSRIVKEEGVGKLWEGAAPTVARAVLLNAGQLAVYADLKEKIGRSTGMSGIPLQFVASLGASVVATALSCPADVLKSRMQSMKAGEYANVVDCARKIVANEGVMALWKGYVPATIKLAPHTVISFIILDSLSRRLLGHSHF